MATTATTETTETTVDEMIAGVRWGTVGKRVSDRCDDFGRGGFGSCMWRSAVGCAELKKALTGLRVRIFLQAGSAWWRRIPEDEAIRRGERTSECFSYDFDFLNPATFGQLLSGNIPEFHAWCTVLFDLPDGSQDARIVDFSAHQFPAIACGEQGNRVVYQEQADGTRCFLSGDDAKMEWLSPIPKNPEVIDPLEFSRGTPGGGIERSFYRVDPLATAGVVECMTLSLLRKERQDPDCRSRTGDLWDVLGRRPMQGDYLSDPTLTPLEVFVRLHRLMLLHPEIVAAHTMTPQSVEGKG